MATKPTQDPVRPEFAVHNLNAEGIAQCEQVRQIVSDALTALEKRVPPGTYRIRVTEKLEEASMLAIRAIALKPEVQG